MSLLERLFGRRPPSAKPSQPHSQLTSSHSQIPSNIAAAQTSTRREMLRVVLRDTLTRHGIPASWITGEMLVATSRQRESGIHWRLVLKHWDPRFPVHTVAFQNHLIKRVMTFDPMAANWLMGISWQYALEDESACPPMPHAGVWTADPPQPSPEPAVAPIGGSAGVIEGPVLIGGGAPPIPVAATASSAKEDLERLFAVRDEDAKRHAATFDATQKMFPPTEPAKLEPRS